MVNLGNDEIVKYPFLTEAGKYLSDKGFSPEQFGTDPDLKKIVDNAFERIITASEGKIFKSDPTSNNSALPLEIFSFLIAVIMLKLSGMNTLNSKIFSSRSPSCRKIPGKGSNQSSGCYQS